MIRIDSNYKDMDNELDRLLSMPTPRMVGHLDAVLELGLETARAKVHVDTGRLKKSGKSRSKAYKNHWDGRFTFGNPSAGVDYAIYEKNRSGDHDFFNQVFLLKSLFKNAILKGLKRK